MKIKKERVSKSLLLVCDVEDCYEMSTKGRGFSSLISTKNVICNNCREFSSYRYQTEQYRIVSQKDYSNAQD